MVKKTVKIDVVTETDATKLDDLQNKIKETKKEAENVIVDINTETGEVTSAQAKIDELDNDTANVNVDVDDDEIDQAQSKADKLDDTEIDLQVDNIASMEALDQIGQGFDRLKAGASELGQQLGTVLESAGKQETNKTFLEMSVGAEQAGKSMQTINSIVQDLPGDDTALQGLLSSAVAKNASLTADELKNMGVASADYFSAMSYYGKSTVEAQQDMTNYILAGNTAELERSPILSAHIDKLKQASTVQERSLALQEALNEEGWGGMSQQDTYNNKLETFNGMLERGKYNLGGMLQEGAKAGMEFALQLDSATGGLFGMTIALGGMASPLADTFMGLGQFAMGLNALKSAYTALIPTQWAEAIAGWASIGWILVAIALGIALGLALVYLWNNSEQFRNGVIWLGNSLKWLAGIIVTNILNQVNRFRQIVMGIPQAIQSCLNWAYNLIMSHPIVQAIIWLGNKISWAFSAIGLGQHSPGKIVQAMERELDWTEEAINNSNLAKSTARLGASLTDNFNPSLNKTSRYETANDLIANNINDSEGTGSTEVNNTFNLGYFTKKEFVDEIIDIIKNEVFWDNKTAGRTN